MPFIIYLSYIFLIRPLLEARAEIQKYFCLFFGEKFRICFRDQLTFTLEFRTFEVWMYGGGQFLPFQNLIDLEAKPVQSKDPFYETPQKIHFNFRVNFYHCMPDLLEVDCSVS